MLCYIFYIFYLNKNLYYYFGFDVAVVVVVVIIKHYHFKTFQKVETDLRRNANFAVDILGHDLHSATLISLSIIPPPPPHHPPQVVTV